MKITSPLILAMISLYKPVVDADNLRSNSIRSFFSEDQKYWNRLLADGLESSLTPPPNVKGSAFPSPSPSDLPSLMTKSCMIEVRGNCDNYSDVFK
jgi:hypothetical protein